MTPVDPSFNQSVAKAFSVIEAFGERVGPLSLNELMELSGLDRNSCQRMLRTLVSLGYIERGPGDRGYLLGKKFLQRTFDYVRGNPLLERAEPMLTEIQQEYGEGIDLSLHDDLDILYALRRQKRRHFISTLVGRKMPVFRTAGGRAIMSRLPDERVADILARSNLVPATPHTIIDPEQIWKKVLQARHDGYAFTEQETFPGEVAVSAAIIDRDGLPIAAIHIYGVLAEWTPEDFAKRFGPIAINAASALSRGSENTFRSLSVEPE